MMKDTHINWSKVTDQKLEKMYLSLLNTPYDDDNADFWKEVNERWGFGIWSIRDVLISKGVQFEVGEFLLIHISGDKSARSVAEILALVCEYTNPNEIRVQPEDRTVSNPPITISLWWD